MKVDPYMAGLCRSLGWLEAARFCARWSIFTPEEFIALCRDLMPRRPRVTR